jgi:hypothetical protein
LSEWVRAVLLAAPGVELPGNESAGEAALAGRVTLAEVLALRTLFLNLQFRQAQGPMTEAEMRGLIERADGVKGERAREHRAGWDATFSAPKSVSVTALVGGDDRVRDAHRDSVRVALDEMEKYAQARIGGNVIVYYPGPGCQTFFLGGPLGSGTTIPICH